MIFTLDRMNILVGSKNSAELKVIDFYQVSFLFSLSFSVYVQQLDNIEFGSDAIPLSCERHLDEL